MSQITPQYSINTVQMSDSTKALFDKHGAKILQHLNLEFLSDDLFEFSADLRVNSEESKVVDVNLYPAGHNNLSVDKIDEYIKAASDFFELANITKVIILMECTTYIHRNINYYLNLEALYKVVAGALGQENVKVMYPHDPFYLQESPKNDKDLKVWTDLNVKIADAKQNGKITYEAEKFEIIEDTIISADWVILSNIDNVKNSGIVGKINNRVLQGLNTGCSWATRSKINTFQEHSYVLSKVIDKIIQEHADDKSDMNLTQVCKDMIEIKDKLIAKTYIFNSCINPSSLQVNAIPIIKKAIKHRLNRNPDAEHIDLYFKVASGTFGDGVVPVSIKTLDILNQQQEIDDKKLEAVAQQIFKSKRGNFSFTALLGNGIHIEKTKDSKPLPLDIIVQEGIKSDLTVDIVEDGIKHPNINAEIVVMQIGNKIFPAFIRRAPFAILNPVNNGIASNLHNLNRGSQEFIPLNIEQEELILDIRSKINLKITQIATSNELLFSKQEDGYAQRLSEISKFKKDLKTKIKTILN